MGLTLQESIDLKNRIDALSQYHTGVDYLSLKTVLYKLVDEIAEAGDGGGTVDASGVDVIPFVVVSSGSIKSAYRYYDDYNSKPRYVQVIPGTTQAASAAASNFIRWSTADSEWQLLGNGGTEYYTSTDDVATPDLVTTWVLASGAVAPLPTVDPYYGTQQDLDEVLARRTEGLDKSHVIFSMTQLGTSNPTVSVFHNDSPLTIVASRTGIGAYLIATGTIVPADVIVFGLGPRETPGSTIMYSDDIAANVRINHAVATDGISVYTTLEDGNACELSMQSIPIIIYFKKH